MLRGVGNGKGPAISKDAAIQLRLRQADGRWTEVIKVICGVVPDGTFPAPLTLGKATLYRLSLHYIPDSITVILRNIRELLILQPLDISLI